MVPVRLRESLQRAEFTRSLGTSDRREAEKAAFSILAEWQKQLAAAEARLATATAPNPPLEPSPLELEEAALHVGFDEARRRLADLMRSKAKAGEAAFAALTGEFQRRHADALRRLLADDLSYWRDRAKRLVAKRNWALPEDSQAFHGLVENLARCGTDLFAYAKLASSGDNASFQQSPDVQKLTNQRDNRAPKGEDIMTLYDRYAADRLSAGKKGKDAIDQDRTIVESFADYVGRERSLRTITLVQVRNWRNDIAAAPPRYRGRKDYSGLSLRQAADKARKTGENGVGLITVNKMLSAVSAIMKWCKSEGYTDCNPCEGLFHAVDKQRNRRPPFSTAQMNLVLMSPLFTGYLEDGREHIVGNVTTRDWKFWIPLLCLFTGARLGEMAQLRVSDIINESGFDMIRISHNPKLGLITKSGVTRLAPIHSILKSIGFMEFVADKRLQFENSGDDRLFNDIERNMRGQYGSVSRFWRTYLKRIGIKQGADGYGSHSFRHGLTDQLRLAGEFDHEIAIVLGHSGRTVTAGYGSMRQGTAERLTAMIESARFEGVSFAHLYLGRRLISPEPQPH